MCNKDLKSNVNQLTWYRNKALIMMGVYESEKVEKFHVWLRKFDNVSNIIKVPDNKKVELFFSMVHNNVHTCVRLTAPLNISELPYKEIIYHYLHHFYSNKVELNSPRTLLRKQFDNETIESYTCSLRKIFRKFISRSENINRFKHLKNGLREKYVENNLRKKRSLKVHECISRVILFAKINQITYYRNHALLKINTYNPEKEGLFYVWLNKFEYVADKIEVPESKMDKLFIEMLDNDVNQSVMQTNFSVDFSELSYDEIINHYLRFFSPHESHLHRERFVLRSQYEEESIKEYADCLRKLISKCEYSEEVKDKLYERFLNGLRENAIRTHLKKSPKISFRKTVKMAIEFEKKNLITYYLNRALSKIDIYNEEKEVEFYVWLNKFEFVANMIDVPNSKMVELFDKMVDNGVHKSVMHYFPFVNFSDLSYNEKINNYLRHYTPNNENFYIKFIYCRTQYEHETIEAYARSLRKKYTRIIDRTAVEERLIKHFINGLREEHVQSHLIRNYCISFDVLLAKAIKFEKDNLISYYRDHALLKINTYNPKKEGLFHVWLNKFEYVAETIEVPDNKMSKLFNKMVDYDVHLSVIQNYPFINFSELSYDEKINHYLRFFSPHDRYLHRKRFIVRNQYKQEPIQNYANCLRKLIRKCDYPDDINDKLYQRFLNGQREICIRTHLCQIPQLTFDETVAEAVEFAKQNLITYYRDQVLLKIDTYTTKTEDLFSVWLNKFEYVADIIKVPENKMGKLFNKMVEYDIHRSVQKNNPSVNFSKLQYEQIIEHYSFYFATSDEIDFHITRFMSRKQYEEESVKQYAISLRKLYNKCYFNKGKEIQLSECFINGIYDKDIVNHLKEISTLSFERIVRRALQLETRTDDYWQYFF